MKFAPLLLLLFVIHTANAQNTGIVNYEYLGIQFTIPIGWVGQEVQGGYLLGSDTDPGFAFISTMEARTMEEMRTIAQRGLQEEGMYLQPQGHLEQVGFDMLGGLFTGVLQGSQVTAYLMGVLNSYGSGVLILAATSPEKYSDTHKQLALQLANSLVFSQPKTAPMEQQWMEKFSNAKLTYMDSYYSGSSGGYQVKREIHLCAEGNFKYSGSSNVSVDTGGAFGNTHGNSGGDGTWEITSDYQGKPLLRLNFHNGEVNEYALSERNNNTLLNGERYYVTYSDEGAEYAPDCF